MQVAAEGIGRVVFLGKILNTPKEKKTDVGTCTCEFCIALVSFKRMDRKLLSQRPLV